MAAGVPAVAPVAPEHALSESQSPSQGRNQGIDVKGTFIVTGAEQQRGTPSWYHVGSVRAAFAPIRAVIAAVGAIVVSGCAVAAQGTPIGMSDAVPEPASSARVVAARSVWPDFAAARAWPAASPPAVALGHRRDGTLVQVRVEPNGLAAYRELSVGSGMPDGARVAAWHETRAGAFLGGYVLEKRGGTWQGLEVGADGALLPGDSARCVRCHDMAPSDHLFGVRVDARPSAPAKSGESIAPAQR